MKTPKIALVTIDYPPMTGGIARFLSSLVAVSDGEIRVLSPSDTALLWSLWPRWWPMVKIIRTRLEPLVFVSHIFPIGTAAFIAKCLGGPEYALLCHGLDVRLVRGIWKRTLFRIMCHGAKAIFAASEATKREILLHVPDAKVTVMTPGIDAKDQIEKNTARKRLGLLMDEPIILSVTRLVERKGIDTAIRAIARVQAETSCMYAVIGEGADSERLKIIEKETGAQVHWLGAVDEETKALWYAAADIFLLPVRDTGNDMEGFGIVYLEAAMAGLPSIAGKSGGASEAVLDGKTGIVIEPENVHAVTTAISELIHDTEKRVVLGKSGRERALREFQWKDRWALLRKLIS